MYLFLEKYVCNLDKPSVSPPLKANDLRSSTATGDKPSSSKPGSWSGGIAGAGIDFGFLKTGRTVASFSIFFLKLV